MASSGTLLSDLNEGPSGSVGGGDNDLVKKIRDLSKTIILSKQISIRKKIGVIRQLIIPILHKQGYGLLKIELV